MQGAHGSVQMQVRAPPKKKGENYLKDNYLLPMFPGKDLGRGNKPVAAVEQIWWFTIDHWRTKQLNKNEQATNEVYESYERKYLQRSFAWAMVVHGNPKKRTKIHFALLSFV